MTDVTSPASADGPSSRGFRRRIEKRQRATEFLAGKPLLIGLDLAKLRHAAWFTGPDLKPIRRFMVPHSIDGIAKLLDQAEFDRVSGSFDRIIVFMEPTCHFWKNVANLLEARGVPYRLISGLAVHRQRDIEHNTYAKGDYRDAELIARLGGSGQWLRQQLSNEPLWTELRALTYEHERVLEAATAERTLVRIHLELVVPEFRETFEDILAKTPRALLRKLTHPVAEIPKSIAELRARAEKTEGFRIRTGKLRKFIARLEAAPSFGVERLLPSSLARLGLTLERFELLSDQREDLRQRVVALYEATPYQKVLDTIPGVGPENHALLLGIIGDPKQYDRATCLAKFAGIEPRENHSGKADGKHSISRRGKAHMRHVLYRIIIGLFTGNPEFGAFINRLRKRDTNPLGWRQAAVAGANKYLRMLHHMCLEGKPYDSSKLAPRPNPT